MIGAPTTGTTVNHWRIVHVAGRVATCQCCCGAIRTIAVAPLADGTASPSCGCQPMTPLQIETQREEVEREVRQRELKNWRPGD